jgi:hypothetical protein
MPGRRSPHYESLPSVSTFECFRYWCMRYHIRFVIARSKRLAYFDTGSGVPSSLQASNDDYNIEDGVLRIFRLRFILRRNRLKRRPLLWASSF